MYIHIYVYYLLLLGGAIGRFGGAIGRFAVDFDFLGLGGDSCVRLCGGLLILCDINLYVINSIMDTLQ
jgi:hypothetical protein